MGSQISGGEELFWAEDLRGLFREDRLANFVPRAGMTLTEQMNAFVRFAVYYAVIMFLFQRRAKAFILPAFVGAVTYALHFVSMRTDNQKQALMEKLDVAQDPISGEVCTRPTRSNPFMNVLVSDFKRFPERPKACSISQHSVADNAERLFQHNLYRDTDDVYGRRTSSRAFYTNPATTIPNDQQGFAQWLYGTGPTCKEGDGNVCAQHLQKAAASSGTM